MGWLQQVSARFGFGSPNALAATDLVLTFDGNTASADTEVRKGKPRSGSLRSGDRIFGDYKIERLLGAGGFGEVYLANMEPEGRPGLRYHVTGVPFALKRIRSDDPALIRALRYELQTWGELPQHPNLLRYRFFRISGDELYIASEYAKGGSLADRLRAGPLPIASAIDLALQIVWGLSALHEAGFLHGDLKPSNVLLNEGGVTALLCDYGLSHRLTTGANDTWYRFWYAPRGHTPAFSSPEQSRGDEMNVAADVWSLGALLLAVTATNARWSDWRSLKLNVQDLVKGLPTGLVRIIFASLQEEAATRASLDDIEISLRETWKETSGAHYSRSRPAVPTAIRQELSDDWYAARSIALQATDPLFEEIDAEEAKPVPDKDRLERLHQIMMTGPQDMTAIAASAGRTSASQDVKILEMLEGACAVYRGLICEGRIDLVKDLGHAAHALSKFHDRRGDFQAAVAALAQVTKLDIAADATSPGWLVSRYVALRETAISLDSDGRPHEAIAILDKATEELGAVLGSVASEDVAREELYGLQFRMLADRGVAFVVADEHENALKAFDIALAFEADFKANKVDEGVIEQEVRANTLVQRANALDHVGLSHEATADYQRAITILEAAGQSYSVAHELESAKLNLGVTLTRMDDTDRAIPLLEWVVAARAARVAPKADDTERPSSRVRSVQQDWEPRHRLAFALYCLADALHRAGEPTRARAFAEQAHEIWKELVEVEGHALLGQYQWHSMWQLGRIGVSELDLENENKSVGSATGVTRK